jgi:hypothetical protein
MNHAVSRWSYGMDPAQRIEGPLPTAQIDVARGQTLGHKPRLIGGLIGPWTKANGEADSGVEVVHQWTGCASAHF